MSELQLSTFCVDVTCPVGHPLCAGWKGPAVGISDPLYAMGLILWGPTKPVVLCAVDWCEISNQSHLRWQKTLAQAVGTDIDHVTVHTTHPHCTPWPDEVASELVDQQEDMKQVMMDSVWCQQALERVAEAVREASKKPRQFTHISLGRAEVDQVASNRRILGADGKSQAVRWTATRDPAVRAEPLGLIDPWLKTISFWDESRKLASLHYYAVHPSSYEDDLMVTPDFIGLARQRRNEEEPQSLHIYFTECAGNITAGKYNDGSRANREIFTQRIYDAMVRSEQLGERVAVDTFKWKTQEVFLPPRDDLSEAELLKVLHDSGQDVVDRIRAAIRVAGWRRQQIPIVFGSLHFPGKACILHLPGESFIEYQLFAQQLSDVAWVAVPSYGDCGPGYICMEESYEQGGYEPTDSFVSPKAEAVMKQAIKKLV